MFESWYSSRVEDEEPTKFWLEFQIISDGFEEPDSKSSYYGDNTHNNDTDHPAQPIEDTLNNLTINKESEAAAPPDTPKFHLFPQLPAELRLKIWSCLIRPRIVLAACLSSRPSTHKPLYRKISQRPKRRYIPILLHICSESRAYALEHYELAFSWKTPHRLRASSPSYSRKTDPKENETPNENNGCNPPKVYFNYALDTLFLLGELEPSDGHGFNAPMVYFLRREDTSRVRHVACAFEELHLGVYDTDLIFGSLFHIVDRFPSARGVLPPGTIADSSVSVQSQSQSHPPTSYNPALGADEREEHPDNRRSSSKDGQSKPTHQYLIITTTPSDASIFPQSRHSQQQHGFPTTNNVIQKLWRAWAMGSGYWPGSGGGVEEPPPPPPSSSDEYPSSSSSSAAAPLNALVNTQMVMIREEELAGFVAQVE